MVLHVKCFRNITLTLIIVFMTVFLTSACAAATVDPATPAAALKMTEDSMRLQAHQTSTAEKAAFVQQQTAAVLTQAAQVTPTSLPTATETPRPTPTTDIRPTQTYEAVKAKIDQYTKDGYLPTGASNYHQLPDFSDSWAQIEWYRWNDTAYSPGSFAIESDIEWASASTTANWFDSGCGYVFHASDEKNHYLVYLGLDGYVYLSSFKQGEYYSMGHSYYGKVDLPNGKAHIALVVNGNHFTFLVNDKLILKTNGFSNQMMDGPLAYVVVSGTNKGFGTSCNFTNTELWTINP